ncbi:MAG: hypothetical protein KJP18_05490 [Gemmatimonadetes bacterium]|nr:hypothetical protein [Gemmatimonadota bacterium]
MKRIGSPGRHVRARGLAVGLAGLTCLTACMPTTPVASPDAVGSAPAATAGTGSGVEVPAGFGSLRQDEVSLRVNRDAVAVQVTPLDEGILRLTAPDTYERLSRLGDRAGPGGRVFLVTVLTEAPGGAEFEPRNVRIESRGIVHRAEAIEPLTPGWGAGPLRQRSVERAVYRFPSGVDPSLDMVILFGNSRSRSWSDVLPRLDAERARVRARAGGGRSQISRPNFLIFR